MQPLCRALAVTTMLLLAAFPAKAQPGNETSYLPPVLTLPSPLPETLYNGGTSGGYFGGTVAAAGKKELLVAHNNGFSESSFRMAHLFDVRTGDLLSTYTAPEPPPATTDDYLDFGASLAAWGKKLVAIGAPAAAVDGKTQAGTVYLYTREGEFLDRLHAPDGIRASARIGHAIASDGKYLAIGAPVSGGGDPANPPAVYVYSSNGEHLYTLHDPFWPADVANRTRFGTRLAAQKGVLLISSPRSDPDGDGNPGAVYVYSMKKQQWLLTLNNPHPFTGGTTQQQFGASTAFVGRNIAVSGGGNYLASTNTAGFAYLFDGKRGDLIHSFPNTSPANAESWAHHVEAAGKKVIAVASFRDPNNRGFVHFYSTKTGLEIATIRADRPLDGHDPLASVGKLFALGLPASLDDAKVNIYAPPAK